SFRDALAIFLHDLPGRDRDLLRRFSLGRAEKAGTVLHALRPRPALDEGVTGGLLALRLRVWHMALAGRASDLRVAFHLTFTAGKLALDCLSHGNLPPATEARETNPIRAARWTTANLSQAIQNLMGSLSY